MKWRIAVLAGAIGLALIFFLPRSTPEAYGQKSGGRRSPVTALTTTVAAEVGPPRATPVPGAAADALRKAQAYYADHIGNIWQLLNVTYPQAAAKRKANPNVAAAHEFFKGYPDALEKARPLKELQKAIDKSFDSMGKEDRDKIGPLIKARAGLVELELYGEMLSDGTAVGTTTLGEIIRETLQSPEAFADARKIVANIERDYLHNEAAAARVEALPPGPELVNHLQASQARYSEHQTQADTALPLNAEQDEVFVREVQVIMMRQVSSEYDQAVFGEEWRLQKTYLAFQKEMRELLAKLPEEDSPEKREILTGLSDVYMRVKQLNEQAATPRAPVQW